VAAEALRRHGPAAAADVLRTHLAEVPDPEVRLGLARHQQTLHQFDDACEQLEVAFREFTEAGLVARAAVAASRLGEFYQSGPGNRIAARGWFTRASRMVEDLEPCLEQGWVALTDVGCNFDDPDDLRERARVALEVARRFGDTDGSRTHRDRPCL
jgi:hypothetical protein